MSCGGHRCTSVRLSHLIAGVGRGEPGFFWIANRGLAGEFPSALQAIDASGRVRSEYRGAGFIGAMAIVKVNSRRLILADNAANETGGAVFDGAANGSSPAADPASRYSGCRERAPLQRKSEVEHLVTPATRPRGKADLFPVLRRDGRGYDRIAGPETR